MLERFRAPPLPNPPAQYDPQYVRQLIRAIEIYFSQLDSLTPNQAQSYRADAFYGGDFSGDEITANAVSTATLSSLISSTGATTANTATVTTLDTDSVFAKTGIIDTLMIDDIYGGRYYGDGRWLEVPYNQFTSDQDQTAPNVAVANALTLNTDDFPNGISVVSNSQITVSDEGIYLITYSIELQNSTNDVQDVNIWFRKNNTDVAASNSNFGLSPRKSTGSPSSLVAVTPFMVDLAANDYIEIMWRPSDVGVTIEHLPAVTASAGVTPDIPATPSAIVTVQFISAQHPPVARIAPLPLVAFGAVGSVSVTIR